MNPEPCKFLTIGCEQFIVEVINIKIATFCGHDALRIIGCFYPCFKF